MIYFIQDSATLLVKVGYTSGDVSRRLAALQTACAASLRLLGQVPGSREREGNLHERFAAQRERGEWFRISEEQVRELLLEGIERDEAGFPIARCVRHRDGVSLVVLACPYCGERHWHGNGGDLHGEPGHRAQHCSDNPMPEVRATRRGYVLRCVAATTGVQRKAAGYL